MSESVNPSAIAARPVDDQASQAAAESQPATAATQAIQAEEGPSYQQQAEFFRSIGMPPMPPAVAEHFRKQHQATQLRRSQQSKPTLPPPEVTLTTENPPAFPPESCATQDAQAGESSLPQSAPTPAPEIPESPKAPPSPQLPETSASPTSAQAELRSSSADPDPADKAQAMQLLLDCLMPLSSASSWTDAPTPQAKPSSSMPDLLPRTMTPARRQASRRNGAKSKGPRTSKGKRRSSMNALKHGILAKDSTWAWEQSNDQTDRVALIQSLKQTHKPKNQLELCLMEMVANDLIRIRRAMAMQESLLDPVPDSDGRGALPRLDPRMMHQSKARMDLITLLRERLRQGQGFNLTPIQAEDLSRFMVERLECWQKVCSQAPQSQEQEDEDHWRLRLPMPVKSLKQVMGHLSPHAPGLLDQPHVSRQLQSQEPICEPLRPRWSLCLDLMGLTLLIYCQQEESHARDHARALQQYRLQQAGQLEQLELLERYETRYRRHLANQMQLLEQCRRLEQELEEEGESDEADESSPFLPNEPGDADLED